MPSLRTRGWLSRPSESSGASSLKTSAFARASVAVTNVSLSEPARFRASIHAARTVILSGVNDLGSEIMTVYYVYIMASNSLVLYVGVTSDLERRVFQHKNQLIEGFTDKYNVDRLVYYESTA